jgi:hypothetical protein
LAANEIAEFHAAYPDLHRTARTLLTRIKVDQDISERIWGHAIGAIEDTYNRYPYEAEMADALLKLANEVERIADPPDDTNVIQLQR